MNWNEGAIIALALLLAGAGGALGAAAVFSLFWRRLQASAVRALEERIAPQIATLRHEQQRMPQSVQQALQVELEFHAREEAERHSRQAAELRDLLRGSLAAYGWTPAAPMSPLSPAQPAAPASPLAAEPGVPPPSSPSDRGAATVDAAKDARPLNALSDAEVDALPPELPAPSRRAKSLLRPPAGIPVKRL
ncbi:MAG: hypothetical protein QM686_21905 [Herbaspirillum sp.]